MDNINSYFEAYLKLAGNPLIKRNIGFYPPHNKINSQFENPNMVRSIPLLKKIPIQRIISIPKPKQRMEKNCIDDNESSQEDHSEFISKGDPKSYSVNSQSKDDSILESRNPLCKKLPLYKFNFHGYLTLYINDMVKSSPLQFTNNNCVSIIKDGLMEKACQIISELIEISRARQQWNPIKSMKTGSVLIIYSVDN